MSRSNSTDRASASHWGVVAEIDRFFGVQDSGSTIATELRGGLTTFVTMAYIVVVNADLLSKAG
ncbi:MAG TPA: NCS2 family permease, partial [Acidobacteriota bacterium]|nr:NCS2 family permease [Acidobacteriota bacterium]